MFLACKASNTLQQILESTDPHYYPKGSGFSYNCFCFCKELGYIQIDSEQIESDKFRESHICQRFLLAKYKQIFMSEFQFSEEFYPVDFINPPNKLRVDSQYLNDQPNIADRSKSLTGLLWMLKLD